MFGTEDKPNKVNALPTRKDVHVLQLEGGWIVTVAGHEEIFFETLCDAEEHGRRVAEREQSKFFVHTECGEIIAKDCFAESVA